MKDRRNLRKLRQGRVKLKSSANKTQPPKVIDEPEAGKIYPGRDKPILTTTFTAVRVDNLEAYKKFCEEYNVTLDRLINDALEGMFE